MKKKYIFLSIIFMLSSCTDKGEIYNSSKHTKKDFSLGNTILMGVGAVGAAMLVDDCYDTNCLGGYGGGSSSRSYTDYDWDWDYQPANGKWVCRGIQSGQYAELDNCAYDYQDDDRWPG